MFRRITPILSLVALLMQVVTGGLPAGEFCMGRCDKEPAADSCCCNDPDEAGVRQARCHCSVGDTPDTGDCEHCAVVQVPQRETIVAQRIAPAADQDVIVCVEPTAAGPASPAEAKMCTPLRPRANESPPHLGTLNITRLII